MTTQPQFVKVPYQIMESCFYDLLIKNGFTDIKARTCAEIFTVNSLEGVYTHGVNRFPRFIKYLQEGHIDPLKEPICKGKAGSMEQWNGQLGPGPLNAIFCTDRVVEIAKDSGIGCVALAETNHWMRGGTYGWRAARKGCIFIGWSNTIANMPVWGALNNKLGNNPLVIAVPYGDNAIVLDMAMSQYSYGAIDFYDLKQQALPVPGGFTIDGKLTSDPSEIKKSQRILPMGYWKGAGLSLLLDIVGTLLSGGLSVAKITDQVAEKGLSQIFMAIDLSKLYNYRTIAASLQQILDDYRTSIPDGSSEILYPGEKALKVRDENKLNGIPVLKSVWDNIQSL